MTEYYLQGHLVATDEEVARYAIAVPEAGDPPGLRSLLQRDPEISPAVLYAVLDGEARSAAGDSDEALEVLRILLGRLRSLFPGQVPDNG